MLKEIIIVALVLNMAVGLFALVKDYVEILMWCILGFGILGLLAQFV